MPISSHDLSKFRNRVFVETGSSGLGLGIRAALNAGFEEVYSVEIDPAQCAECQAIYKDDKRVHLTLGDCGVWLDKTLDMINEPCTIYLDANGVRAETDPFNMAIEAIIRHGRKDHTILVDDMNHGLQSFEYVEKSLLSTDNHIGNQLRRINPDYKMYIIDSHSEDMTYTYPAWVAVAEPKK